MDLSYILHGGRLQPDALAAFGFVPVKRENSSRGGETASLSVYAYRTDLSTPDFYVVFTLDVAAACFEAHVFDKETGERYALFDMERASGSFVGGLREEVRALAEDMRARCFESESLRDKYVSWLENRFACKADFPWEDTPDACVFRLPNKKWFALVMKIKYRAIQGLTGDEEVFVVNLKADADKIAESSDEQNTCQAGACDADNEPLLIDRRSVFPAYHMNKKYWITVLLTSVTDFDRLCRMTERSYELVEKPHGR